MSHADRVIGMILLNCSAAAGPGSSWFAVGSLFIQTKFGIFLKETLTTYSVTFFLSQPDNFKLVYFVSVICYIDF
jgi:hypothetical protein